MTHIGTTAVFRFSSPKNNHMIIYVIQQRTVHNKFEPDISVGPNAVVSNYGIQPTLWLHDIFSGNPNCAL